MKLISFTYGTPASRLASNPAYSLESNHAGAETLVKLLTTRTFLPLPDSGMPTLRVSEGKLFPPLLNAVTR